MLSHPPNVMPQLCAADLKRAPSAASSSTSTGCKLASSSTTHNRMLSLEHDPSYMSSLKTLHAKIGAESAKQRRRSLRTSTPLNASPRLGGHLALSSSPYATSTFYDSEDDDLDTSSDSEAEDEESISTNSTRRSSFVTPPQPSSSSMQLLASPGFSTAPPTPHTPSSRRPSSSRDSSRRRSLLVPEAPRSPVLPRSSFSSARRDDWQSSFTGLVDVQCAATATRTSIDSTSATAVAAAATHSSSGTATPSASASTSRAASPIAEQAAMHPSGSPIKATFIKTRRTFSSMPSSAHGSQSRSRRAESAPPPRPEDVAFAGEGSEAARVYTPSAQPNLSTILSVAPLSEQGERRYLTPPSPPLRAVTSKRSAARAAHDDDEAASAQVAAAAVQKNYALRTKLQAWTLGIRFSAIRARRKWNAATGQHA